MKQRSASWLLACAATVVVAAGCEREPGDVDRTPSAEANPPAAGAEAGARDFQDGWITTKIEAAYFADADVKGRTIDVTTDNGVVTLTGTVEDQKARDQAVAIARSIDGVTRVEDRLAAGTAPARAEAQPPAQQPPPATPAPGESAESARSAETSEVEEAGANLSNVWITTKIEAQYFADDAVKGRRIDVSTNNGVVTLAGQVQSEAEKERAMNIARQTEGVRRVEDRLRVTAMTAETGGPAAGAPGAPAPAQVAGEPQDPTTVEAPMAERMTDEGITTRVQSKLFLDETVKDRDIEVTTNSGEVTLSGEVANETERQQVLSVARSVAGVTGVQDQLQVNQSVAQKSMEGTTAGASSGQAGGADDAWITTKVQSEYFLDEEVKKGDVDVNSEGGVVTLTGEVQSPEAKRRAETIARQVSGVTQVENELSVSPEVESPPEVVSPVPRPESAPGQPETGPEPIPE